MTDSVKVWVRRAVVMVVELKCPNISAEASEAPVLPVPPIEEISPEPLPAREVDGAPKDVEDAAVLSGSGQGAEPAVHPLGVGGAKGADGRVSEPPEVGRDTLADSRDGFEVLRSWGNGRRS